MKPVRFDPYIKRTIWGSETWTLSAVTGHESVSSSGTLPELIAREKGTLVGEKVYAKFGTKFPLLVKLIDAHDDLSVQVHPNDTLAAKRHNSFGKTEMWYVVKTEPGAKIYAGLRNPVAPEKIETDLADALAAHESHPGDVFYLPAGRVHAIGAGNYLAEIQQTSDITYRVYDYNRKGPDGQPRELHVDLAREAIDYTVQPDYRTSYDRDAAVAELVDSPYFRVGRVCVADEATVDLKTESFVIAVCLEGAAEVNGVAASAGETLLVPASDNILRLRGTATFLTAVLDIKDIEK